MEKIRKFESIQEAVNALGEVIALHHLNNGYSAMMRNRILQEKKQNEIRQSMEEKTLNYFKKITGVSEKDAREIFNSLLGYRGKNFYQMKAMAYTDDSWRYYRSLV